MVINHVVRVFFFFFNHLVVRACVCVCGCGSHVYTKRHIPPPCGCVAVLQYPKYSVMFFLFINSPEFIHLIFI